MSMKDYATRAFQSSDQRYARIFEKMGYTKDAPVVEVEVEEEDDRPKRRKPKVKAEDPDVQVVEAEVLDSDK